MNDTPQWTLFLSAWAAGAGGGCVPSIETVEIIRQKMYVAHKLTILTPELRIRIKMIMPVNVSSICY